ncbi:MAG TPA: polyketide synthase, partial [Candidatus Dormibacteraeota bacterium]|nr:polyketide synthase [Candidatus Dormibacteraeota bacterium]
MDELADAIAVIGMAVRLPGANCLDELWANLCGGVESIRAFTSTQLRAAGVEERLLADPAYVAARGAIDGADHFDAEFFGMSAAEASATDPQQRLLLECAWAALEDAGHPPGPAPVTGVFVGGRSSRYPLGVAGADPLGTGSDPGFLALQVAYRLDLVGPSLTVQTACSSSLVAVHLACTALLGGECDQALAGGVALHLPLVAGYLREEGSILSPDGHCRPFDADAAGTVTGDGVAVVVLRRLADAIAAGDAIYALVLGSATNNDGADRVGFEAPGVRGQARVVRSALQAAGVAAGTIDYVEAHGTGTPLGDAVELA